MDSGVFWFPIVESVREKMSQKLISFNNIPIFHYIVWALCITERVTMVERNLLTKKKKTLLLFIYLF